VFIANGPAARPANPIVLRVNRNDRARDRRYTDVIAIMTFCLHR
jgi:hypothetical protein